MTNDSHFSKRQSSREDSKMENDFQSIYFRFEPFKIDFNQKNLKKFKKFHMMVIFAILAKNIDFYISFLEIFHPLKLYCDNFSLLHVSLCPLS